MFIIAHSSMTRYELFFCFAEQSLGTFDLGMHILCPLKARYNHGSVGQNASSSFSAAE